MQEGPGKDKRDSKGAEAPKFSGPPAEYLRIHKARIVTQWTEATRREVLVANELATVTLIDSLPEFLDDLADSLENGRLNLEVFQAEVTKAKEHGATRAIHSRYSVTHVQDEYRILQRVLFEELEETVALSRRDREILFESILLGMRGATAEFAEQLLERERQAREEAQKSSAALNALIHSAPLAFAFLDKDLRYLMVNENLARLNGVPVSKHLGKYVREVLREGADRVEKLLRDVLRSGESILNFETEAKTPGDGDRSHWFLANFFPVRTEEGATIGVGGAVVDVTEQKKTELRLREVENYRSQIFESSEDCFKVLDLQGTLLSIEKESLKHLEIEDASTITGSNWIEFWKRPEDKAAAREAVAKAAEGSRGELTGHFPTPSGKRSWWHVVLTPIRDDTGRPVKILAVSRDVTALRRAEEEARRLEGMLWAISDAIPTRIGLVGQDERFQFVNRSLAQYLGTSVRALPSKTLRELLPPETYERLEPYIRQALSGQPVKFEFEDRTPNGDSVFYSNEYVPMFSGKAVTGFLGAATDVTALKNVELALRSREEEFRALANSIPQLSWIADPSGYIFWYNDRWYQFTGTDFETMKGRGWQSVHHPDYVDKVTEEFKRHVESGEPWEDTFPLRGKNGEWHWFLSRARPIKDERGWVLRWFGTNTDVTEQREIQRQLRESKERYDLALEVGRIGVWEMNLQGSEVTWSPRQYEIFGLDPAAPAITYEKFYEAILPEDRPRVDKELTESVAARRDFNLEYRITRGAGDVRWVRANGKIVLDANGAPSRMIGVNVDVTNEKRAEAALRDSEERLRGLMDAVPAHLWSALPDGTITFLNRFWGEYTGQDVAVTIRDGTWINAIHPEDRRPVLDHWRQAVRENVPFYQEYRIRHARDGTYRWHVTRGTPVKDSNGHIRKWVGLSTDVDDLKRTQKLLEESQALRERFTNTLTHDLRNPLTAAKMSAQLVLRSREDAEKRDRHLHKITEAIERADRMIGDLLDANRIKAGEALPLRLTDCDLRAIAVQSLDELSVLYGDRFVLRDDGPCVGHWSCEGLRRVVDNLATNAVKYGAPNSPITVTLTHHEGEVRIQVHNEGNELSQEELGGLFDLYKRSRKAEASEVKGWGIGLTLVKGIVEAHGGRVKAESGRGAGTTFTVDLPRRFTP